MSSKERDQKINKVIQENNAENEELNSPMSLMTEREAASRVQALSKRINKAKQQEEDSNNTPQKTNPLEEEQSQIDWSVLDKETDYDLLDELDLQEEGQHLPMQDYVSNQETTDSYSKKPGKLREMRYKKPKKFL